MNILLDTQVFLWHIEDNPLLKLEDSRIIEEPSHTKFLSIASLWEIAIKTSLGKLTITQPLDRIIPKEIQIGSSGIGKAAAMKIIKCIDFGWSRTIFPNPCTLFNVFE